MSIPEVTGFNLKFGFNKNEFRKTFLYKTLNFLNRPACNEQSPRLDREK